MSGEPYYLTFFSVQGHQTKVRSSGEYATCLNYIDYKMGILFGIILYRINRRRAGRSFLDPSLGGGMFEYYLFLWVIGIGVLEHLR